MGDSMKKVHPGDKLRIPAATFNTLIDVARDHLANRQNATRQPGVILPPPGVILTIRNDSDEDRARFEVLGLDSPVFPPEDNTADFSRGPVMSCVTPATPDHEGAFVVLLEPIADGKVGQAILQGAAYVKVDMASLDDEYAEVTDGETGYLTSGESGSARIIWHEDAEEPGQLWCVCLLTGQAGAKTDESGGSFTVHYSMSGYYDQWPEEVTFYTLAGSTNSILQIAVDVRMCQWDLPIGNHPGNAEANTTNGFAGNCIAAWEGDDDTWFDLTYTARDPNGDLIGTGTEAISSFKIQARVATSGDLEIRTQNNGNMYDSCVIAGVVWRKTYPAAPGTKEIGAGGCHDDETWGDGVWEPEE